MLSDQADGSGLTPLHAAAMSGKIECVRALLGAKASVSVESQDGRFVL